MVDCYLTCENPDSLYTLLRRTLTSIIHHCKGAEQFSGIGDILITRFLTAVSQSPSNDAETERLRRILQLVSVVCSVRQGSRLSREFIPPFIASSCDNSVYKAPQLSQLASVLPNIHISPPIQTALLHFSVAVLTAGDMSLATSSGRLFISEALKVHKFGASLLGTLAELSWGGWKLVALPALFRSTGDFLSTEPKQTLRLFASLCYANKLGEVDVVWRRTIDMWLCERLSRWELSPGDVDELRNFLSLSPYVDRMPALLVGIVQRMLDAPDPEASWYASHGNAAWVLSICMHALAGSKNASWRQQVDLVAWTRTVARRWSWSQCALSGLADVVHSR